MNYVKLCGDYINPVQIACIKPEVRGKDCGAPFDTQDHLYLVVCLSNSMQYRIPYSADASFARVVKELGLTDIGVVV